MYRALRITKKIFFTTLITMVSLVILVLGGLNLAKFAIYHDYYAMKSNVCGNPGLGDGFVCQGVAVSEEHSRILVSGYMKDGTASRVYVTDFESNSYYVTLTKKQEIFKGHAGGIAISGDTVLIANGKRLYQVPLEEFLNADEGDVIEIGSGVKVNNNASFVYADDTHVYVGEFYDEGKYETDHTYKTGDGVYHAIVTRYAADDLETPEKIYAVRDHVQGMCVTPEGKIVLSTSYGLTSSVYYIYQEADAADSGLTLDGTPVFYLDNCMERFEGPAMGEDMDYSDGKVITLTESASDKYIFGKLFFAYYIVGLEIED